MHIKFEDKNNVWMKKLGIHNYPGTKENKKIVFILAHKHQQQLFFLVQGIVNK